MFYKELARESPAEAKYALSILKKTVKSHPVEYRRTYALRAVHKRAFFSDTIAVFGILVSL